MNWRKVGMGAKRNGSAEPQRTSEGDIDDTPSATSTGCGCAGLPELQTLVNDTHEALAIALIRFVFAGYFNGKVENWDRGFEVAAEVLGPDGGEVFFGRVLALGRAIKSERRGDFTFLPGHCTRISEHETELLTAIQASRSADPRLHDEAMLVLSRQGQALRMGQALCHLANLLGVMADDQMPAHVKPSATPDRRHLH